MSMLPVKQRDHGCGTDVVDNRHRGSRALRPPAPGPAGPECRARKRCRSPRMAQPARFCGLPLLIPEVAAISPIAATSSGKPCSADVDRPEPRASLREYEEEHGHQAVVNPEHSGLSMTKLPIPATTGMSSSQIGRTWRSRRSSRDRHVRTMPPANPLQEIARGSCCLHGNLGPNSATRRRPTPAARAHGCRIRPPGARLRNSMRRRSRCAGHRQRSCGRSSYLRSICLSIGGRYAWKTGRKAQHASACPMRSDITGSTTPAEEPGPQIRN